MIYQGGKRTKIIAASTAPEFEAKLNAELATLDRARSKYDLQFNHNMGFCAYIVIELMQQIPETIQEEFEVAGERHTCLDCPYWQHPTKGNVKYTRCEITPGIHGAKSPACEAFYEMLFAGDLEIENHRKEVAT